MNARKAIELMTRYSNCPTCGNDKVGNGEGKLIIEDTVFIRECKCGFKIMLDENGKEVINNI